MVPVSLRNNQDPEFEEVRSRLFDEKATTVLDLRRNTLHVRITSFFPMDERMKKQC